MSEFSDISEMPMSDEMSMGHVGLAMGMAPFLDLEKARRFFKDENVNERLDDGSTYLMSAASWGAPEVVKFLLDEGADIHIRDNEGRTALIEGAHRLKISKMLLDKEADPHAEDNEGTTVLMKAALRGSPEAVKLLLDKGVDVNAQNKKGETALMKAIHWGNLGVVKLLLSRGADVYAKKKDGTTTLELAEERELFSKEALITQEERQNHSEVVELLKKEIEEVTKAHNPTIFLKGNPPKTYFGGDIRRFSRGAQSYTIHG